MTASFPATRLRRTRTTAWSRAMHREIVLSPADLIWPVFVIEGSNASEPIVVRVGDTPPLVLPPSPSIGAFLSRCASGPRAAAGDAQAVRRRDRGRSLD